MEDERSKNEAVQWLLNNREPWDSVIKNWKKCIDFRLQDLISKPGNIQTIFEHWPVLQQPRGIELVGFIKYMADFCMNKTFYMILNNCFFDSR